MSSGIVERIHAFNVDRDAKILQRKYEKIVQDSFTFFRGTCHLFYEDWPQQSPLNEAPSTWICGDLHVENFGTYKGNNSLVYFDVNDFDESALAPCTWEITRLATSILVGAKTMDIDSSEGQVLVMHLLDAYQDALLARKALWVEHDIAAGLIQSLMEKVSDRNHEALLKKYAVHEDGYFEVSADSSPSKHVLPLDAENRNIAECLFAKFVTQEHPDEDIKLLDAAYRIAGTGSLGIPRYILLVKHEKKLRFLDIKQSRRSSLTTHLSIPQPTWESEAQRISTLQSRYQAISPALLTPLTFADQSYVLRELQPSEDKINFTGKEVSFKKQVAVLQTMAVIAAWDHLRGSGQQGSATVDSLVEFAQQSAWKIQIYDYAKSYSQVVEEYWQAWQRDWQK
jgi:uncharacterized protein (DUF2252 family)